MAFKNLLKAALMNQATHTQGHMDEAYRQGMSPAYVDWSEGVEVVPRWVSNPKTDQQKRAASIWHGAGFKGQAEAGEQLQGTELELPYRAIEGLSKLGYIAGMKTSGTQGDIENLERTSGNKLIKPIVGVSAVVDLLKAYKPNKDWDVRFVTPQGAPGLMFNKRF